MLICFRNGGRLQSDHRTRILVNSRMRVARSTFKVRPGHAEAIWKLGEKFTINNPTISLHLLTLAAFSAALFMPMMGRGFILDDFGHLFVAGQESVRFGLTRASGGPYYAPVAYGSFKVDWILWGARPFPWAVSNLLLHIANTWLLYFVALGPWRPHAAAWWAGFGFALSFPANVAAV